MWQRLKKFAGRHRKKLIFSGVVIGGAVFTYRVVLPKIQERLLKKLLEQAGPLLNEELLKGKSKRSRSEFQHKQEVSDTYARRALAGLSVRHASLFKVDECRARLQEAGLNRDAKLERFKEMQVELLARAVSATYTLVVLMLLYRVAFNIIGRSIGVSSDAPSAPNGNFSASANEAAGGGQADPAHEAFLSLSATAFEERGLAEIATSAREAVSARCDAEGVLPTKQLSSEDLERLLLETCRSIDERIFTSKVSDGGEVSMCASILPESLDKEIDEEAKPLLDEARDYLESPQFLEVVRRVVALSIGHFVQKLGASAGIESGAPLPVLAKLFGPITDLSREVLTAEDFTDGFTKEPLVQEFCEALFFQGGEAEGPGCPQQ